MVGRAAEGRDGSGGIAIVQEDAYCVVTLVDHRDVESLSAAVLEASCGHGVRKLAGREIEFLGECSAAIVRQNGHSVILGARCSAKLVVLRQHEVGLGRVPVKFRCRDVFRKPDVVGVGIDRREGRGIGRASDRLSRRACVKRDSCRSE